MQSACPMAPIAEDDGGGEADTVLIPPVADPAEAAESTPGAPEQIIFRI